jgi:hypothetical protein
MKNETKASVSKLGGVLVVVSFSKMWTRSGHFVFQNDLQKAQKKIKIPFNKSPYKYTRIFLWAIYGGGVNLMWGFCC